MSKRKIKRLLKKSQGYKSSKIRDHKVEGEKLIPPLLQMPQSKPISWMNDRLPDILWAVLLVSNLPRAQALSVFREVANYIGKLEDEKTGDVTHTGLSRMNPERLNELLNIIVGREGQRRVLIPLMLFRELPARGYWGRALGTQTTPSGAELLMKAVGKTLYHQSQEATDCRWLKVLCAISAGRMKFPSNLKETVKGIVLYPNYGDMRSVRPSVRAAEMSLEKMDQGKRDWPAKFWQECFNSTPCFPLGLQREEKSVVVGTTSQRVKKVYNKLAEHARNTQETTGIDARHDTVFGIGLCCLSILEELLSVGNSQSIIGRTGLRTMVECYITLAYLVRKDEGQLWTSYRIFGSGQAKLTSLKLEEASKNPSFVDLDTLKDLANEDIWEELLTIDLGHWDKANLRKLSEAAGTKDEYDRFYYWTSTFAHGHWGALRDTVFDTCGNPLHRLHRIPRDTARACPDVIPDACELIDKILDIIATCYPPFGERVTIES